MYKLTKLFQMFSNENLTLVNLEIFRLPIIDENYNTSLEKNL